MAMRVDLSMSGEYLGMGKRCRTADVQNVAARKPCVGARALAATGNRICSFFIRRNSLR